MHEFLGLVYCLLIISAEAFEFVDESLKNDTEVIKAVKK